MIMVIKELYSVGISLVVILITSIILKKNWYDKLDKDDILTDNTTTYLL